MPKPSFLDMGLSNRPQSAEASVLTEDGMIVHYDDTDSVMGVPILNAGTR
jgi:hypothetical protein